MSWCPLCQAFKLTPWYFEDELIWVADCQTCCSPMVVARLHLSDEEAPDSLKNYMLKKLIEVADAQLGENNYWLDTRGRAIRTHLHYHARRMS